MSLSIGLQDIFVFCIAQMPDAGALISPLPEEIQSSSQFVPGFHIWHTHSPIYILSSIPWWLPGSITSSGFRFETY